MILQVIVTRIYVVVIGTIHFHNIRYKMSITFSSDLGYVLRPYCHIVQQTEQQCWSTMHEFMLSMTSDHISLKKVKNH